MFKKEILGELIAATSLSGVESASRIIMGTAILAGVGLAPQAFAQETTSLEEIVVTATKRDEMVQDVPVAVTAVTQAMIETNQITSVNDLGGMAPNLTVRPASGGINLPTFNMRGITSFGVVAGSDKQISIYLDGVYIGAPRGSIFTLPDIQQLEVLRGPQGTLFGRNATGGAISVTTRSPSGVLGFRQKVTRGSRDLVATETTIETPTVGPFSAYFTYSQESQDGDVRNLGAGTIWDRTAFGGGVDKSPKYLGSKDTESYFLAVQFQPRDDLTLSYKLDYGTDKGSPQANAPIGNLFVPAGATTPATAANPAGNTLINALIRDNTTAETFGSYTRPDAVNNAWTLNRDQKVQGHNLTLSWDINDSLSLKNTLGYRKTELFSVSDLGGSTWTVGPATSAFLTSPTNLLNPAFNGGPIPNYPVGTLAIMAGTQANSDGDHWSDEIQLDYDTDFVTIVTGALYYESDDESGSPRNSRNSFRITAPSPTAAVQGFFPGNAIPSGSQGVSLNEAKSYAVFSQASFHMTDELDLLAGLRYTKDEKSGDWVTTNAENVANPTQSFDYDDNNISYLVGASYHLTEDILVYAKLSTAYVSGGAVSDIEFDAETSKSYEIGSKAEFLDGRLRTNLALFDVTYDHLQSPNGGAAINRPDLSTLIVDGGRLDAKGVELEVAAIPLDGLTVGAALGYQDVKYDEVSALNLASVSAGSLTVGTGLQAPLPTTVTLPAIPGSSFEPTNAPKWSGNLSANYDTDPVFGSAYASFGITGAWRDKSRIETNPARGDLYGVQYTPATWIVNARAALKGIELSQDWEGEVAVWGKNLTDDDHVAFPGLNINANFYVGNFTEERSFGIDLIAKY